MMSVHRVFSVKNGQRPSGPYLPANQESALEESRTLNRAGLIVPSSSLDKSSDHTEWHAGGRTSELDILTMH